MVCADRKVLLCIGANVGAGYYGMPPRDIICIATVAAFSVQPPRFGPPPPSPPSGSVPTATSVTAAEHNADEVHVLRPENCESTFFLPHSFSEAKKKSYVQSLRPVRPYSFPPYSAL